MPKMKSKREKELKTATILIRVTESKKKEMVGKAKQRGVNLTKYIENLSDKTVVISLIEAQKLVKEIHQLNLKLEEYNKLDVNTDELQDVISRQVLLLQKRLKGEV